MRGYERKSPWLKKALRIRYREYKEEIVKNRVRSVSCRRRTGERKMIVQEERLGKPVPHALTQEVPLTFFHPRLHE